MKSTAMSALLTALLASLIALPAAAAERERGVNARQRFQQQRIQQGVRQGDLTRGEARHLQREKRDIRREERAFRSDGRFTATERREVHRDLDRLSRDIRRERHDGDRRFWDRRGDHRFAGYRGEQRFPGYYGRPHFGNEWRRAGPRSEPGIDRIQQRQHDHIAQGVRSGELTRREAHQLIEEQRAIRAEERAYLADGVLTRAERTDLYEDLSDARQHIYNETHDAQTRR